MHDPSNDSGSLAHATPTPLPIDVAGRWFPKAMVADREQRRQRSLQTQSGNEASLYDTLMELVRRQLPLAAVSAAKPLPEFTERYIAVLGVLSSLQDDVQQLAAAMCAANFELRKDATRGDTPAREALAKESVSAWQEHAKITFRPSPNAMHADNLALPLEEFRDLAIRSLEQALEEFVQDFVSGLETLVDNEIAGLVEWTAQNVCKYHFFRKVIVEKIEEKTEERGRVRHEANAVSGRTQTVTEKTAGTYTHQWARHEHHAIEAFHTSIANATVVQPAAVQNLLKHVPDWLSPLVRIIDGHLVREIIIERDVKTEKWTDVVTRDEPVFGLEPAVVLGHIVLTGWGPTDIETELQRRKAEQVERQRVLAEQQHNLYRFGGIAADVLALSTFFLIHGVIGFVLATVLVAAGVVCWMRWLRTLAVAAEKQLPPHQPVVHSLGVALLTLSVGIALAFGFPSWSFLAWPLTALTAGVVLLCFPRFSE